MDYGSLTFASKLEEFAISFTPGFSPVFGDTKQCVKPFNGLFLD